MASNLGFCSGSKNSDLPGRRTGVAYAQLLTALYTSNRLPRMLSFFKYFHHLATARSNKNNTNEVSSPTAIDKGLCIAATAPPGKQNHTHPTCRAASDDDVVCESS